jgi:hypothetical protein
MIDLSIENIAWPRSFRLPVRILVVGSWLGVLGAAISLADYFLGGPQPVVQSWPIGGPTTGLVLGVCDLVVLAPLFETALMICAILGLVRARLPIRWIPLVSACGWAVLHWLFRHGAMHLWTFVPFYVFTVALLSFQSIRSNRAFLSVVTCHGIMNLVTIVGALFIGTILQPTTKRPNQQPPLRTPVSGTPAAKASVVPPPGAAGR